jgi:1-acyl-sn-glycerol-3-phosphate acyltransferase
MTGSHARAILRLITYVALTLPLMPVQAVFVWLDSRFAGRLPLLYHRLSCRVFGIDVERRGTPSSDRPTLFVANHLSYLDIAVLASQVETSFVAKREIAGWPLFGRLAKLQRTVFVGRERRGVATEADDVGRALRRGRSLILFPEGTSCDGQRVRPFKSSLLAVAEAAPEGRPLTVQPVTLVYARLDGMPIGRALRPLFTWFGDMTLPDHMFTLLGLGRVTAVVEFHEPVTLARFGSRKALAQYCEETVGRALAEINAGRRAGPAPAGGPSP